MAVSTLTFFGLLVLMSGSTAVVGVAGSDGLAEKSMLHLHLYFHEFFEGSPSPTSYLVASLHNNSTSFFGDIRVFDNALREGQDVSSKLIGRAQGMIVNDSLGIRAALTMINFVFTDGSSLAVNGRPDASVVVSEHSVVGGTGQFRMARGYGLSKILTYNATYLVVEYDFFVSPAAY